MFRGVWRWLWWATGGTEEGPAPPTGTSPGHETRVNFSSQGIVGNWPVQTQGKVNFPPQDHVGENWT